LAWICFGISREFAWENAGFFWYFLGHLPWKFIGNLHAKSQVFSYAQIGQGGAWWFKLMSDDLI
jgi:hypothetical protein